MSTLELFSCRNLRFTHPFCLYFQHTLICRCVPMFIYKCHAQTEQSVRNRYTTRKYFLTWKRYVAPASQFISMEQLRSRSPVPQASLQWKQRWVSFPPASAFVLMQRQEALQPKIVWNSQNYTPTQELSCISGFCSLDRASPCSCSIFITLCYSSF